MFPPAGERQVRFVGDALAFTLAHPRAREWAEAGWTARLDRKSTRLNSSHT